MSLSQFNGPYETWFLDTGVKFTFPEGVNPITNTGIGGFAAMADFEGLSNQQASSGLNSAEGQIDQTPISFRPVLLLFDKDNSLSKNADQVSLIPYSVVPMLMVVDTLTPTDKALSTNDFFSVARFNSAIRSLSNETLLFPSGELAAFPVSTEKINTEGRFSLNFPFHESSLPAESNINVSELPSSFVPYEKTLVRLQQLSQQTPELTIVAVIDDGLPIAHQNFLDNHGQTRIECCWLQAAEPDFDVNVDPSVPLGRELTRNQIQNVIDINNGDEDAIYRHESLGTVNDLTDQGYNIFNAQTHGAHVMDTACGFGPGDYELGENGDLLRIIGVQLPRNPLRDTSGFGKDVYILGGLHYIFSRAESLRKAYSANKVNLLINISLGVTGGPHDGTHVLEAAIDELVKHKRQNSEFGKIKIALPAANSFADRMHIKFDDEMWSKQESHEINWVVQPNDRTSSYLELWFEYEGHDKVDSKISDFVGKFKVSAISPNGEVVENPMSVSTPADNPPNIAIQRILSDGETIGQITVDRYREKKWRVSVFLGPTEPLSLESKTFARSGTWKINIENIGNAQKVNVDGYIHRDEDPAATGNGGRQSYFYDENYQLYDHEGRRHGMAGGNAQETSSPIRRHGSINGWATVVPKEGDIQARFAIGGYVPQSPKDVQEIGLEPAFHLADEDKNPARYSGAGNFDKNNSNTPVDPKVHFSNPSDRSPLHAGVRASGTRSGSTAYLQGTSAAAPQFIRQNMLDLIARASQMSEVGTNEIKTDPNHAVRLGKIYNQRGRRRGPRPGHSLGNRD